ncbi:MAG: MFS transporter [Candidatus Saccharibacteria bacterium]
MATPRSKWLILAIIAIAQFMVILDTSIVNVALPAIQKALNFSSPTSLQWIVTAYTLAFGGFLLLGGRAADLYGRKKMFLLGVGGFTLSSLAVALSNTSNILIVLRAVQGLSAAFMSPAALSILLITFRDGEDRNKALSVWSAVAAGGAAAGVLFGGILTQYLGWRWDFLVNLPVGIIVSIIAYRILPAHESEATHTSLDLPGAALVTSGLMLLVYGLVKAPTNGWNSANTIYMLGGAAALLVAFVINEFRAKHPLVDLNIFRQGNVAAANVTQMAITATLFSMFFFLSLYIQQVLGYSPVRSGLAFLPITFIIGMTATYVGRIIGRVGFKPFMVVAPLILASALYLLAGVPVHGSYLHNVLPGLIIMAIGLGMSFVSLTIAATAGVAPDKSGLASGLINTSQQIGGALGLAILSGVSTSAITKYITDAHQIVTPSLRVEATVSGFHAAFHVGMGFAIAASVITFIFVRSNRAPKATTSDAPVVMAH